MAQDFQCESLASQDSGEKKPGALIFQLLLYVVIAPFCFWFSDFFLGQFCHTKRDQPIQKKLVKSDVIPAVTSTELVQEDLETIKERR